MLSSQLLAVNVPSQRSLLARTPFVPALNHPDGGPDR
ncbi:MAG: hypothetical protein JWN95_1915 [Frankiales bacterium]|nr:hypothetical protein [Frankiales bacterium]